MRLRMTEGERRVWRFIAPLGYVWNISVPLLWAVPHWMDIWCGLSGLAYMCVIWDVTKPGVKVR